MKGTYYVYSGDELIAVSENIITEQGQASVVQFLAGAQNSLGDYMAFGIGESTPEATDLRLDFEYHRVEVDLKQPQLAENKVVIRGTIPDEKAFELHEIGLFLDDDIIDELAPNALITSFDIRDEAEWLIWDGVDFLDDEEDLEYLGGRTGPGSFQLDVPGNATWSLIRDGSFGSFAGMQNEDEFALAYETLSGGGTLRVRFRFDDSNYREYVFTTQPGFNIQRWAKSQFTSVGSSEWDDMRSLEIVLEAGSGGGHVIFEGLRYDMVSPNERPELVSRSVLSSPISKRNTSELQIEYVVDVAFTLNEE